MVIFLLENGYIFGIKGYFLRGGEETVKLWLKNLYILLKRAIFVRKKGFFC